MSDIQDPPSDPLGTPGALFFDIATLTVDPAYVEAAARRAARDGSQPGWRSRAGVALLLAMAALGLLLAVAALQTRLRAPEIARLRAALVEEARDRERAVAVLERDADALRTETDALRDRQLRSSREGREVSAQLDRLSAAVGTVPVTGPAVEVVLRDSDEAGGPDDPSEDGRVRDRDVQDVVNALWAAGAEAVAVNGQRISALTAIREAGRAILVDYLPVTAPYVVTAVGDPDVLEPEFAASDTAARFRTFADVYGLGFAVRRRDEVTLPAAQPPPLRHARSGAAS